MASIGAVDDWFSAIALLLLIGGVSGYAAYEAWYPGSVGACQKAVQEEASRRRPDVDPVVDKCTDVDKDGLRWCFITALSRGERKTFSVLTSCKGAAPVFATNDYAPN